MVLTMCLSMMFGMVSAQGYLRIDTVISPYIDLDYQAWMDSGKPLVIGISPLTFEHYGVQNRVYGDLVQYNYIAGGADIYGLEVWVNIIEPLGHFTTESPYPPEYLYLYDARPDTFELKAQIPLVNVNPTMERWNCYYHHRPPIQDTICKDFMTLNSDLMHRYRYFFDSPIHVDDSFYVGASDMTARYYEMFDDTTYTEATPRRFYLDYGYMSSEAIVNVPGPSQHRGDDCQLPYRKKKVRWGDEYIPGGVSAPVVSSYPMMIPGVWEVCATTRELYMIFPLIKTYDTIWVEELPDCNPVTGFSIMSRFGDTVMLRWNPVEGRSEYQVSYGPQGTEPDRGTFEHVTTNRWRYIDTLHTGEVMVAYVRTVCREMDTLRYSDWSEAVEWQGREERVAIVQPDVDICMSSRVYLRPNPATDKVEIVTPCGVKGIEVYGSYGIRWREFPAGTTVLDVSDWAKGAYVVVIHTLSGSVTKKLVVE